MSRMFGKIGNRKDSNKKIKKDCRKIVLRKGVSYSYELFRTL